MFAATRPGANLRLTLPIAVSAIAILFVGSAGVAQEAESYCGYAFADTTDWERQNEGEFTFLMPPGYGLVERGGFDSVGATFRRGEQSLFYDYGSFGNPLTEERMSDVASYRSCPEPMNEAARIVIFDLEEERSMSAVGAFWEDIEGPPIEVHLSFLGSVPEGPLDSAVVSEYLTVLRSVEFAK